MISNSYKDFSGKQHENLAIFVFGLIWFPGETKNSTVEEISNAIINIIELEKFNESDALKFRLDLSLVNLFWMIYVINLFFNEEDAKKIIDPMCDYFFFLFDMDFSKIKTKKELEAANLRVSQIIKRESERKLIKVEVEKNTYEEVDFDSLIMPPRTLLEMLYNIRMVNYKNAFEEQGNLGPAFSVAREFSRQFTGNENDRENKTLVLDLSALFAITIICFRNLFNEDK